MKKLLSLCLVMLMLFSLAGCQKETLAETFEASNGDEIKITLTTGIDPSVVVSVNGDKIYSFDDFTKYKDEYDFEKDFNLEIKKEFSDDEILWAYNFDWGSIYSTKHDYLNTTTDDDDSTLIYVCPKHDYKKCCVTNIGYYKIVREWSLLEDRSLWLSHTEAQVIIEQFYDTKKYTLTEIDDLEKAGYSIDDYYDIHQCQLYSGAANDDWQKLYEISLYGKPFALMYLYPPHGYYKFQELDWEAPLAVYYRHTKDGAEYYMTLPDGTDVTEFS